MGTASGADPYAPQMTREQELDFLRNQAEAIGEQLEEVEKRMRELMAERHEELGPCTSYANWFDNQRRVVRNAAGPLGDAEAEPDWSRFG